MNSNVVIRHQIARVRRETRKRLLTVGAVERLTPQMQRVHFISPDLEDFDSAAPDDHIKLFVPAPPLQGGGMVKRDYTPRTFDTKAGLLIIDFALHDAGPATAWALAAKAGDTLEIGGPRGSNIVPDDFDWYLLIGDETALPAIGRRVEELRPGVPVTTVVVVDSDAERQVFRTPAAWTPLWVLRDSRSLDDAALLKRTLASHALPPGDGYVWIAAEARVAHALRGYMKEDRGHPELWTKASGYWTRGEAAND